jgi:M6 family metalloprotease-like protein
VGFTFDLGFGAGGFSSAGSCQPKLSVTDAKGVITSKTVGSTLSFRQPSSAPKPTPTPTPKPTPEPTPEPTLANSASAEYEVSQRTLAIFSGSATNLTPQQKAQVKAAVDANPSAEKFICTGIRFVSQPMSENIKVRKRAKAACDYAKSLNPALSTFYQNKPTKARSYAGKVLLTIKSPQADPLSESFAALPVEMCKLQDARVIKRQPNNVGFPLQKDTIPVVGEANLLVVPVSFTDAKPENDLLPWAKGQMDQMVDWYEYFSQGKLSFNVQFPTDWVELDVPSTDYSAQKGVANVAPSEADRLRNARQIELTQRVIDNLGSAVDYTELHGIILIFPRSAVGITTSILQRGIGVSTPNGNQSIFVWGSGLDHYSTPDLEWALWAHELLHSQGVALHAPGNGSDFGLGQNQYARSSTPNGWEMFRMGWYDDSQIACIDGSKLDSEQIVNLSALEVADKSQKLLVVKLSNTKALVVESRRPVGYSKAFKELSGLVVYQIDVTLDNDRASESTGDPGNSVEYDKWGYLLAPDGTPNTVASTRDSNKFIFKTGDTVTLPEFSLRLAVSGSLDSVMLRPRN